MRKRLKRLEQNTNKLAEIAERQSSTLIELATDVKHHIRRTDELQAIVIPVKSKMDMIMGAIKLAGAVGIGALIKALYGP